MSETEQDLGDKTTKGQPQEPALKGEGSTGEWLALAQAVFPNSRSMTREERREFDAAFWSNLTPLDGAA